MTNINSDMLMGPRGIHTIENHFKDIKFRGKGYEREDLNNIMKRLEHWSHRLFPRYGFDDNLDAIERLGKKKVVQAHMTKYRKNMLCNEEIHLNAEKSDDENQLEPFDEMDALLDQQIEKSKFDQTHTSAAKSFSVGGRDRDDEFNSLINSPRPSVSRMSFNSLYDDMPFSSTPAPFSRPSSPVRPANKLSAEQMAIIAENRLKAQQRLLESRNRKALQQIEDEIEMEEYNAI